MSRRRRDRPDRAGPGPKDVDVDAGAAGVGSPNGRRASSKPLPHSPRPMRGEPEFRGFPRRSPRLRGSFARGGTPDRRILPDELDELDLEEILTAQAAIDARRRRIHLDAASAHRWPRKRSIPSSNRRSARRSRRSRSSSAMRWACKCGGPEDRTRARRGARPRRPIRPRTRADQAPHPGRSSVAATRS